MAVVVSVPFGLATVLDATSVRASMTTGLPVDFALAIASSMACCRGVRAGAGVDETRGATPPTGPWVGAGGESAATAEGAVSRPRLTRHPVPSAVMRLGRVRIDGGCVFVVVRGVVDMALL
ncbi:hypothetical protein GCM10010502_70690 [Kitasatospora aureofaciens]|uniref:Uncharacterized protein n=1 Tax=Kitasatospora aureofaciens TaxID=1894 RepID=A0A8H9LUQ2_KITAU|nr:hypothetical protein GCM10010502_70690 [Kitasatospora aureofaciens]